MIRTDVAIIGGGLGACVAALGAARVGYRVALTEETHWIGGQLTNQADEHSWIEEFGATACYRALREGIRQYYPTIFRSRRWRGRRNVSIRGTAASADFVTTRAWLSLFSIRCRSVLARSAAKCL